jgi:hippurate hydrolase
VIQLLGVALSLIAVFEARLATAARPAALSGLDDFYPSLDALYRDLHSHPELSGQERETAAKLAVRLRAAGFEVTEGVGGHGIVGVLANGGGRTVLVRADMDALPIKEATGLPYASAVVATNAAGEEVPVMHACGHDIHMAAWVGAAELLAAARESWRGTLVFVGQPAEETLTGARAMIDDGLFERFPRPDFALAIHDTSQLPAGAISVLDGPVAAAANGVRITFHGRGGHGAYPHATIDPIVIAARTVVTLQTIVAREINPFDTAVVSVGTFSAGQKLNVIPDDATIELTVRSFKPDVQSHLLRAIERIARAEAAAAAAPREPTVTVLETDAAHVLVSDPEATTHVRVALQNALGEGRIVAGVPGMSSEDFGEFGTAAGVPSVQLRVGASDAEALAAANAAGRTLPGPHNAGFAPAREPTIRGGVEAYTIGTLALLNR